MEVKIDKEACIGCGTCVSICEDVFDIDDDGLAMVKNVDEVASNEDVDIAIDSCPTSAIKKTA